MQPSSYLYDYLELLKRPRIWLFQDEIVRSLRLDPNVVKISHAISLEDEPYYLVTFKTPLGVIPPEGVDLRLPINSHTINPRGLVNVIDYHISIYRTPEIIRKSATEYISDLHLTLEYDQSYVAGHRRKPCTTHLYYEVILQPKGPHFRLQKITVTANDNSPAKRTTLDRSVQKECLNIIQTYARPIVIVQYAWFQKLESKLHDEERGLLVRGSRLQDLLRTAIYQPFKSMQLHPSQRAFLGGREQPLSITAQEAIIENCATELHANIESLLLGSMDACINLAKLKQDIESSIEKIQDVEEYRAYAVDRLQSMLQLIDLYELNNFRAIVDLSAENRDVFIKFLTDSFFDESKILSFRNILKRDKIIEGLQSVALSLQSDSSENGIALQCLEVCANLKKFDQYSAIQQTTQKLTRLLSRDRSITKDELLEFSKDIEAIRSYYKKLRRVLSAFYKAKTIKKQYDIVEESYVVIKNGAFLMADFLINPTADSQGVAEFSLLLAEEPQPIEKITENLMQSYQKNPTGGIGGEVGLLSLLEEALERKISIVNSSGAEMFADSDALSISASPVLLSAASLSESAASIESSLSILRAEAKSFTPSQTTVSAATTDSKSLGASLRAEAKSFTPSQATVSAAKTDSKPLATALSAEAKSVAPSQETGFDTTADRKVLGAHLTAGAKSFSSKSKK